MKTSKIEIEPTKNTLDAAMQLLRDKGGKWLARGAYASVYKMPDDSIAKIYDPINDVGYDRFLSFATKTRKFKHRVPIIHEILTIKSLHGLSTKIVFMERLKHKRGKAELMYVDDHTTISRYAFDDKEYFDMIRALDKIAGRNYHFDLHSENIMFRGEDWVVTDPFVW